MAAHDSVLAARVKQTRTANKHQQASPFEKGDLIYLSTKNMSFPVPNDDQLFPGRSDSQIVATDQGTEPEWAADKITNHSGSGNDIIFEVLWKLGDITWISYAQIRDLNLLEPYLEALGADGIANLPHGSSTPPHDPQIFVANLMFPQAIKMALDFQPYHTTPPLPLDHC